MKRNRLPTRGQHRRQRRKPKKVCRAEGVRIVVPTKLYNFWRWFGLNMLANGDAFQLYWQRRWFELKREAQRRARSKIIS